MGREITWRAKGQGKNPEGIGTGKEPGGHRGRERTWRTKGQGKNLEGIGAGKEPGGHRGRERTWQNSWRKTSVSETWEETS